MPLGLNAGRDDRAGVDQRPRGRPQTSATFGHIIRCIGHSGRVFARRMRSRGPEDAADSRLAGGSGSRLRWGTLNPQRITRGHPLETRKSPKGAQRMITRRDLLRGVAGTAGLLAWPPGHAFGATPRGMTRLSITPIL